MKYEFDDYQLIDYSNSLERSEFAPCSLFRQHFGLPTNYTIPVDDVEDFMIAFYTTYNRTFGVKY